MLPVNSSINVATPMSRRDALRLGLATAGSAAFGAHALAGAPTAQAALQTTRQFDITAPSTRLLGSIVLRQKYRVMQSFCFNRELQRLYFFQLRTGTSLGDCCITEVDLSGRVLGYMDVDNAGHGSSIGCETIDGKPYLWVEADGVRRGDYVWGSSLGRFPFISGTRPVIETFLPGSRRITCATDAVYGRMAVRRRDEDERPWITVYDMNDATRGDFSNPLSHVRCRGTRDTVFQGYTLHGSYIYTIDGEGQTDPSISKINSYINVFDANTGKLLDRAITRAGSTLVYREPEGMSVITTPDGASRLAFGLASRRTLAAPERYQTVYCKDLLMRPAPGSSTWNP